MDNRLIDGISRELGPAKDYHVDHVKLLTLHWFRSFSSGLANANVSFTVNLLLEIDPPLIPML